MKEKLLILVIIIVVIFGLTAYVNHHTNDQSLPLITNTNNKISMEINFSSPAFGDNEAIPSEYTCDGNNIIPPLKISGVGADAKSLAIVVDDPDAASVVGHTFDHWVIFNIPPDTDMVKEGVQPNGIAGKNGKDELTYTGPCPPNGTHHYHFKLYALDTILGLKEGATKNELEEAMDGHIIGQTQFIGIYTR